MSDEEEVEKPKPGTLITVTSEGGGSAAIETMLRAAGTLAKGLRRAVPFLTRRAVVIKPGQPAIINSNNLSYELSAPVLNIPLVAEPGGTRAAICLDGPAIGFLLEGSLGGDGSDPPKLNPKGLSAAQNAFMERVVASVVDCISDSLRTATGLRLNRIPSTGGEKSAGGTMVVLPLAFIDNAAGSSDGEDSEDDDLFSSEEEEEAPQEANQHGQVLLAISKNGLMRARSDTTKKRQIRAVEPRLMATMQEAEVEVIAELGRISLTLGQLTALKLGDTLRLDIPVNGDIDVRVEDQFLFKGQPTTSGTQLAIQIVGRQAGGPASGRGGPSSIP